MKDTTILIIKDDVDIREGIRILLESENYLVHEAAFSTCLCPVKKA